MQAHDRLIVDERALVEPIVLERSVPDWDAWLTLACEHRIDWALRVRWDAATPPHKRYELRAYPVGPEYPPHGIRAFGASPAGAAARARQKLAELLEL